MDRKSGQLIQEKIANYLKTALRLLYANGTGRKVRKRDFFFLKKSFLSLFLFILFCDR